MASSAWRPPRRKRRASKPGCPNVSSSSRQTLAPWPDSVSKWNLKKCRGTGVASAARRRRLKASRPRISCFQKLRASSSGPAPMPNAAHVSMAKLAPAPTMPSREPYVRSRPSRKRWVASLPLSQRPRAAGSRPSAAPASRSQLRWALPLEKLRPSGEPSRPRATPHSLTRMARAQRSPSSVPALTMRFTCATRKWFEKTENCRISSATSCSLASPSANQAVKRLSVITGCSKSSRRRTCLKALKSFMQPL